MELQRDRHRRHFRSSLRRQKFSDLGQGRVPWVRDVPVYELRDPGVADLGFIGNSFPITAAALQQFAYLNIEPCTHRPILAKFCDVGKQHFATPLLQTSSVEKKPINVVLAEALAFFMGTRWNNSSLGREAGVAPNTVRNYLNPLARDQGASGKPASAKLAELEAIARALGVEVIDLLTDASADERTRTHRKRAADHYVEHGVWPEWAPPVVEEEQSTVPGELGTHAVVLGHGAVREASKKDRRK